MLKPDSVARDLVGDIIGRFEKKGLNIAAMKLIQLDLETASKLYGVHKDKEFYDALLKYVTSGPVVVMVIDGYRAIEGVRMMVGATDPISAEKGSIRGDFALFIRKNLVHASDSKESAAREISIFFSDEEVLIYNKPTGIWVYEE